MMEDVTRRLASFGYTVTPEDDFALGFCIQKVEQDIKNSCNLSQVPEELHHVEVDMVVGEFLLGKKAMPGGLPGFDLEAAEKTVQVGDTQVAFAVESGQSAEQRLDSLIARLLTPGQSFAHFRRLRW